MISLSRIVLTLICVSPYVLFANPPTNPELGNPDSRYVLEIFTSSDCGSCAHLHREFIALFPQSELSSSIRLRIRTVPPTSEEPHTVAYSLALFCMQVFPSWHLHHGRDIVFSMVNGFSPALRRRFDRCFHDPRVSEVMRFNRSEQLRYGFLGVPAFRLLTNEETRCEDCSWQGYLSAPELRRQVQKRIKLND